MSPFKVIMKFGHMGQHLGALVALKGDLGSVPRTNIVVHKYL